MGVSCYYGIQALEKPILLIGLEILILLSLGLSIWFFKKLRLPKDFLTISKQTIIENDFNIQYLQTDNDQLNALYDIFNTMIEKILKERRFSEEQNHFLKDVMTASPTGIILLDLEDKIESINPKAMKCLKMDESDIGSLLSASKCILPIDLTISKPKVVNLGGSQKMRYSVSTFYYRGFNRKMITVNDLQTELLEAEKASYSKVIRMMAHEINNSIGPINSILNTVKDEYPNDELINEVLTTAIGRTESLNIFMQNFASVVRLPDPILEYQDVVPVLKSAIQLMTHTLKDKNIEIHQNILPSLHLKIDSHQMEQVFINILKNSVDAIDENGLIKIELSKNKLIFSDNGCGISESNAKELFSPFFTTKPTGQGIGLMIVKRVLVGHGFEFELMSDGSWTDFGIKF